MSPIKNFFLILIVFNSTNSISQEDTTGFYRQSEIVYEIYDQVNSLTDLILLDNLLKDTLITLPKVRAMVYMARAEKHWDFIYDEIIYMSGEFGEEGENDIDDDFHLKQIISDYDTAIEMCKECSVEYQFKRFLFLQDVQNNQEELEISDFNEYNLRYKSDSVEMKSMGYRYDRAGYGVGLNGIRGNENWIGGEISVGTFLEPINRLKYTSQVDGKIKRYWINRFPVEASWTTLGYNYSISNGYHDIYFDLMNLTSPIHVTIMKFGAMKTDYSSKLLWYYRPEIGFGFGNISFYYAYNAIFKKSMRDLSERHLIGIRIKLIPVKY